MESVSSSPGPGEISKTYDVKRDVNETAKRLDTILLTLFGFDAPYVKAFPHANQIIVTGKPEYFDDIENWLAKLEKNPVPLPSAAAVQPASAQPAHAAIIPVRPLTDGIATEVLVPFPVRDFRSPVAAGLRTGRSRRSPRGTVELETALAFSL